jgi:prepilin signal peptidase PulO-like enzyme (type II secretory pathway)
MIIAALIVLGLSLGSFVNALVWRVRQQERAKKSDTGLSVLRGRSMCPHCKHQLAAKDLVPLISWLSLRGKCRYCGKPIGVQYPLIEAFTAIAFVASYLWWPQDLHGGGVVLFILWLPILTGLIALLVYDLKWFLLPNRILYPLGYLSAAYAFISIASADDHFKALLNTILAVVVGGGLFYLLYQFSKGKWIGGGDVKLGWVLGMLVVTPARSLLFIFIASVLGTLVSIPLLASNRLKRTSTIPFGPFLIVGAILTVLFGSDILHWYRMSLLGFY